MTRTEELGEFHCLVQEHTAASTSATAGSKLEDAEKSLQRAVVSCMSEVR